METLVSRRNFLRASAVAAAGYSLAPGLPAAAELTRADGKPSPVRLGLTSYTFRNFTREQLIGYMKQLQVNELNPKDTRDHLPMDPTEEAMAVEDYRAAGIHLHAAGAIYFRGDTPGLREDSDADIRSKFEYCKRAGIGVIVAGDPTPELLPHLEKYVREYDIRIAIHNHGPEDKQWPSPLDVLKAVDRMDPRLGCCIDVGHTVRAGTDVVQAIHAVGPRLFNVHMKDLTDFTAKESQVAVGEGIMPVRRIFEALIAIQYKGFVDLEYEVHAEDPLPGALRSFAYMRGVLAGMGYNSHA